MSKTGIYAAGLFWLVFFLGSGYALLAHFSKNENSRQDPIVLEDPQEWQCLETERRTRSTLIRVGDVTVPQTQFIDECINYKRNEKK